VGVKVTFEEGSDEGFNEGFLLIAEVGLLVILAVGETPVRGIGMSDVQRD